MKLRFTKMQGCGNDFVMLDGVGQRLELSAERVRRLADRHFGVGADQVLVVEPAPDAQVDFGYRIFNADGGEVEQCGNGARCFVKFVHALGLTDRRTIRVRTAGGVIVPRLEDDGEVTVDMGVPDFDPDAVGWRGAGQPLRSVGAMPLLALELDGTTLALGLVSMGNPHAVQLVEDVALAPVTTQGPRLERHPHFARGVNAGYLQLVDRGQARLRVWERGAGETLACGTGACAAAACAMRMGLADTPLRIQTRGGPLRIAWAGDGAPVAMTGPAQSVFEGSIELP